MNIPETKSELQQMLKDKSASPFYRSTCANCHKFPRQADWILAKSPAGKNIKTPITLNELRLVTYFSEMNIFATTKRQGKFRDWEPFYIGTNREPTYDEWISGKDEGDKLLHGYILCLLDYDFHVLSDGFLVHRPGVKSVRDAPGTQVNSNKVTFEEIVPQLKTIYGERKGCYP